MEGMEVRRNSHPRVFAKTKERLYRISNSLGILTFKKVSGEHRITP